MTQRAYCARHGVSLRSPQRWQEVLCQERADSPGQQNAVRLVLAQGVDAPPVASDATDPRAAGCAEPGDRREHFLPQAGLAVLQAAA